MSTIKDVAKLANVSISTVSYVMNNTGNISDETKCRVKDAAKTLEYTPNGNARSLKMKKNNIIAVVVYTFGGPVYDEIIRGIREIAQNNKYEVIIAESCSENSTVTKILAERLVDGVIILSANVDSETIKSLSGKHFPIVTLDRKISGDYISNVLIDNANASYEVVQYLSQCGYKKIGMISGPKNTYDSNKRIEGFKKAVKEYHIENMNQWNIVGDFTEQGGYQIMSQLIKENNMPEAYFICNDEMAIGAMRACKELGVVIPDDLGIIGFDDINLCEYVTPRLTTVRRPSYESGIVAANSLITTLKGERASRCVVLTSELIVRDSCREPKEMHSDCTPDSAGR